MAGLLCRKRRSAAVNGLRGRSWRRGLVAGVANTLHEEEGWGKEPAAAKGDRRETQRRKEPSRSAREGRVAGARVRRASPHGSAWIMLPSGCGSLNLSKASQFGSALRALACLRVQPTARIRHRSLRLCALPAAPDVGPFLLYVVCCERILPLGVITSALASRSGIMQRYIYVPFFGIGKTQEAFGSIGEACACLRTAKDVRIGAHSKGGFHGSARLR